MMANLRKSIFWLTLCCCLCVTLQSAAPFCNEKTHDAFKVLVEIVNMIVTERKQLEVLQQENGDLKQELKECTPTTCNNLLVYGLGKTTTKLSSSSVWDSRHGAHRSVLHTVAGKGGTGAWSSKSLNNEQYLQFEFPIIRLAAGIVTQGRNDADQWGTKYRVSYSLDCKDWKTVDGTHVFAGNSDRNTLQKNNFQHRIKAKCIRINPTAWHGHISMRADVIGCPV